MLPRSTVTIESNVSLRDRVMGHILPRVQTPAQYAGGELHAVHKPAGSVRGRFLLAFPDLYTIGMSHHGLQVLYAAINGMSDWACERAFAPAPDMEALLRAEGLPLYSLESFTPLAAFDLVGFTLQYELCYTNLLTMLDLGGIPLRSADRSQRDPLVVAGGPSVANPEPVAEFIDVFVVGDGEAALPSLCRAWLELKDAGLSRDEALAELARRLEFAYVPRFYAPPSAGGRNVGPTLPGLPDVVRPAVIEDLDAVPVPTRPVMPYIECVQDRITLEIMRGCPGKCRFCQSTTLKRPLRYRRVETLVAAALETYRNTGFNEISLLSLSTSDYPHFAELMQRMQETFRPLGVSISVPSLRVNEQLRSIGDFLFTDRTSGLTLAPEVARDAMRKRIGKAITNDDLYAGCRSAMTKGFQRVKLYFMCGLPGETDDDLDGMIEMAEVISRIGKEVNGRFADVVVNVSNFVPKPQTPYQWNAMQRREYFVAAHRRLRDRVRFRNIQVKCHDVETSLLEGVLCRGDRTMGKVIERAWRGGGRLDAWREHARPDLWWQALADAGVDIEAVLHTPVEARQRLPWDHIGIRQGRSYLERQSELAQCAAPADDGFPQAGT